MWIAERRGAREKCGRRHQMGRQNSVRLEEEGRSKRLQKEGRSERIQKEGRRKRLQMERATSLQKGCHREAFLAAQGFNDAVNQGKQRNCCLHNRPLS